MILNKLLAVLSVIVLVTGCSSKNTEDLPESALSEVAKGFLQGRILAPAPATAPPDLSKGPAILTKFLNFGVEQRMVVLDQDGDVTIWHDGQGHQLATRQGVLIWTRGIGGDLMSAQVPSPGVIRAGGQHQRVHVYVDGTDRRYEWVFDCSVARPVKPDSSSPGQHLVESCQSSRGNVQNEYWMRGNQVVKSRQWISVSYGHVEITAQ